ncbi:hypothetical protein [Dictyobacter arantiisoli]|uniref:Uncharacterized protein n=1 Tax=Dictyobacter arantiisoli TaxID=2014874 RepID=A0A5A5TCF5_9CHLR|nr:hypothetical protein [Dictyobacter arantiisoli]GCF08699.1 hypothetical protein KDI_22630 [Dictyobacter arantiisoli]
MLNDKGVVIDQLAALADMIKPGDEKGAERLHELRDAVADGKYADAWSGNNIYKMIDIDALVNRFRVQQRVDNLAVWIDAVRNICIFLPLFFTWLAISKAIPAYYTLVTQYPKNSTTPFLQLWQGGFNDTVPWYDRLAGVASIDVGLILVIVLLTVSSSILNNYFQLKQDRKAELLRDDLAHALAGATLFLSIRNRSQPVNFVDRFNTVVDNFTTMVAGFEAQMKSEREEMSQLIKRQKEEFALFNSFKASLVTSMDNVASSIRDLDQSNKVLNTTVDQLVTPTQETVGQQKDMLTISGHIQQQLTRQADAQEEVVRQQNLWGEKLNNVLVVLDGTVNEARTLAGSISHYTDEQKELVRELQVEHNAQRQLVTNMIDHTTVLHHMTEKVDASANNISGATVNISDIARRIAANIPA